MLNRKSLLHPILALLFTFGLTPTHARQAPSVDVPTNFRLDREVAARLRPALLRESEEPTGFSIIGAKVLHLLLQQTPTEYKFPTFSWELRITKQAAEPNAFSSPDGTIYVDRSLAQLLGSQPGLWAAALSHEIAHILHRDWARRYLYEESTRNDAASVLSLGGSGTTGAWIDPANSANMSSRFSRMLENSADADGLMLMARAGYHPDFMFSLHHLLRARALENAGTTSDSLHPEWGPREETLRTVYAMAGHEYERLWPEMSESPGGVPPVVVSAGEPTTRKPTASGTEILIPLRCSNLSGAVEVVLELHEKGTPSRRTADDHSPSEWRQVTGCTSAVTQIRFHIAESALLAHTHSSADIYVTDDRGKLVAASDVFKLGR